MKHIITFSGLLFISTFTIAQNDSISISRVEIERNTLDRSPVLRTANAGRTIDFGPSDVLSTPNPSPEAVALYRYIQDMFGKKILSGQMWAPWGINEMDYVISKTGKKPAVAGFDYINEPQNPGENQKAIDYWKNGGITTMMWHWGAPGVGEGYENSKATIDIDQCFIENTPEYDDFWADLERIGDYLQVLEDENVPVLWRPFHELDGGWFWWSKEGPEKFKLLWTTMFDYFVKERGLNNLIWVLCYTGDPDGAWFPGDEYVDIAGADTYDELPDSHLSMYNDVLGSIDGNNYPITFHETGNIPNAEECIVDGAMWSWWMVWHTDWLEGIETDYLKEQYESHLVVTHDELPDILSAYGWDESCEQSKIVASIQIDNGDWSETNKVITGSGSTIRFRVETNDEGTWHWEGYNTSNNADSSPTEQVVNMNAPGVATATFTNSCGATSTQTFHVIKRELATPLSGKEKLPKNLTIYPTLTDQFLSIQIGSEYASGNKALQIYDLKGRQTIESNFAGSETTIDVGGLVSGVYVLLITGDRIHQTRKFVKK